MLGSHIYLKFMGKMKAQNDWMEDDDDDYDRGDDDHQHKQRCNKNMSDENEWNSLAITCPV